MAWGADTFVKEHVYVTAIHYKRSRSRSQGQSHGVTKDISSKKLCHEQIVLLTSNLIRAYSTTGAIFKLECIATAS